MSKMSVKDPNKEGLGLSYGKLGREIEWDIMNTAPGKKRWLFPLKKRFDKPFSGKR